MFFISLSKQPKIYKKNKKKEINKESLVGWLAQEQIEFRFIFYRISIIKMKRMRENITCEWYAIVICCNIWTQVLNIRRRWNWIMICILNLIIQYLIQFIKRFLSLKTIIDVIYCTSSITFLLIINFRTNFKNAKLFITIFFSLSFVAAFNIIPS